LSNLQIQVLIILDLSIMNTMNPLKKYK